MELIGTTAQQAHAVRRRYASSKIGAILKASFGSTVISIYRGGAADAPLVRPPYQCHLKLDTLVYKTNVLFLFTSLTGHGRMIQVGIFRLES